MIRNQTIITCALGALIATTVAFGLTAQEVNPQVAALNAEIKTLKKDMKTFTEYMEAQAKAGKELSDALARAEAEGFTAGINPSSREALLSGLRAQAEAMQAGPDAEEDVETKPRSTRGRRRGK